MTEPNTLPLTEDVVTLCNSCGIRHRVGRDNTLCDATLAAPAPLTDAEVARWRADQYAVVQPSLSHLRLLATIDALKSEIATLTQLVCDFQAAALIDVGGDPGHVEPHHVEQEITTLREQIATLTATNKRLSEALGRALDENGRGPNRCRTCTFTRDHPFHVPLAECARENDGTGCREPNDHHAFVERTDWLTAALSEVTR